MKPLIAFLALSLFAACAKPNFDVDEPGAAGQPQAPPVPPARGAPADDGCRAGGVRADLVAPATDMMLVVDRSGQMLRKAPDGQIEWDILRSKVDAFAKSIDRRDFRLGLSLYPQGAATVTCCKIDPATNSISCGCKAGELPPPAAQCSIPPYQSPTLPLTPPGAERAKALGTALSPLTGFYDRGSSVPPMRAVGDLLRKEANGARKVIVLVSTEWLDSCDDRPGAAAAVAVENAKGQPPIATHVVGIATYQSDLAFHSAVGAAGQPHRAGCEATTSCYERVNRPTYAADLERALVSIAKREVSCTLEVPVLTGANGTPRVNLIRGDVRSEIARDPGHAEGWDFVEARRLQLFGTACDALAKGGASTEIVYGCSDGTDAGSGDAAR